MENTKQFFSTITLKNNSIIKKLIIAFKKFQKKKIELNDEERLNIQIKNI